MPTQLEQHATIDKKVCARREMKAAERVDDFFNLAHFDACLWKEGICGSSARPFAT